MPAPLEHYRTRSRKAHNQPMNRDYGCFYIDGSHLFVCIEKVKRDHPELTNSKLNIEKLTDYLTSVFEQNFSSSIRAIYYFKKGDLRIQKLLTIPALHGQNGHWQIKECGQNLRGAIPESELNKLSEEYRDIYPRAEKGVDMELACDALTLAANGAAQCFVFMINDRDFIPLLHAIQRFGANTYIAGLDIKQKVQESLLSLADRYVTLESHLNDIFDYTPPVVKRSRSRPVNPKA